MGVSIYLEVSNSVTREEWQDVYQETLRLIKEFPLAERLKTPVRGIPTMCLVPTREREETYGWKNKKVRTGWFADGDYDSLCTAETFFLPRDLVTEDAFEADASDALFARIPSCLAGYDWKDERFQHCHSLWGAKTQGEPYHIYLLSIASLIVSRLGRKADVYGDITKGQCVRAVRMANEYLDCKIDTPDQCDEDRLLGRIKGFPLTEVEKLMLFVNLGIGKRETDFGTYLRKHFTERAIDEYWRKRFGEYQISSRGFDSAFEEYLLWGFDLEKLCSYVCFTDEEGATHYEDFVNRVMDAKLHHRDTDCTDVLKIDPDEEEPYGVGTVFAQIFFAGARNKKVDRYIPLEIIREALLHAIGDRCPVDELIEGYLQREATQELSNGSGEASAEGAWEDAEADASSLLAKAVQSYMDAYSKLNEEYDIWRSEDLPYYEVGDTVRPNLLDALSKSFAFYQGSLSEDSYSELMAGTTEERCRWLVRENRYILLRDCDWLKIFDDIMEHPESFSRYYPMVRVVADREGTQCMVRAFVTNDALYSFASELETSATYCV